MDLVPEAILTELVKTSLHLNETRTKLSILFSFNFSDLRPMMNPKELCRHANRVELSTQFSGSAGSLESSLYSLDETFQKALALLNQIDPIWLKSTYDNATASVIDIPQGKIDSVAWKEGQRVLTDLMHQLGVHQKAIERLGTLVSKWDFSVPSYSSLVESWERLLSIASAPSRSSSFQGGPGFESSNSASVVQPMTFLANACYGLALMANLSTNIAGPQWTSPLQACCANLTVASASQLH